jgi:ribosomal protein L14
MSYAERFHITAASQDGRVYRVSLRQAGYGGSATALVGSAEPFTLEVGTPGLQGVWAQGLTPQRFTIEFITNGVDVSSLYAVTPDEWLVLLEEVGSPNVLHWWGYLQPGRLRTGLYRTDVASVQANGFLQTLADIEYTPIGTYVNLVEALADACTNAQQATTPPGAGIVCLSQFYPYLTGLVAGGEPLESLAVQDGVWKEQTFRQAWQSVVNSLSLEAFTSGRYIWLVNRGAILDLITPLGSSASSPHRLLEWAGTWDDPALTGAVLKRDVDTYNVVYAPFERESQPPESIHVAAYRWTSDGGAVLTNATFQDPAIGDTGGSEDPRWWSVAIQPDGTRQGYTWTVAAAGGYRRARRVFLNSAVISGENAPNTYALQVVSEEDGFEALAVRQKTGFRIPGGADNSLKIDVSGRRVLLPNDPFEDANFYVYVQDGADTWYLVRNAIATSTQTITGDSIVISVDDGDAENKWDSGAVNGTVLVRKGTVLQNGTSSVTLTEDFKVGDAVILGRHQLTSTSSFTGGFTYWHWRKTNTPERPGIVFPTTGTVGSSFRPITELFTVLQDPQGRPVSGAAYFDIYQHPVGAGDTPGAGVYTVYRQAALTLTRGGSDARGIEVTTDTSERGIREELPVGQLGDGPTFDSLSGLWWEDDSTTPATYHSTLQLGTLTSPQAAGWKRGVYANTSEASTGYTLEEARARDAGRQMSGQTDMIYATAVIRPGNNLVLPHHVTEIEGVWRWRTYYRWRIAAGQVELHAPALDTRSTTPTVTRRVL